VSDDSVHAALRSDATLVAVEAPGSCGKTYQGAGYARDIADSISPGRLLILTHTHAACSVFHGRTRGLGSHVEIRPIDSLVSQLTDAYHAGIGLRPARSEPAFPVINICLANLLFGIHDEGTPCHHRLAKRATRIEQ
jgi:hypothetical protein